MTAITITIWHNVRTDPGGRGLAMLDGYTRVTPWSVFTYQTQPGGRSPEQLAEDAFAAFNGHLADAEGAALARRYYGRQLRSLSFSGNSPCCSRSCCLHRRAVWPGSSSTWPGARASRECQRDTRR